jgi:hypothetical protein
MPYPVKDISALLPRHETARPPHLPEDDTVNVMIHNSGAENDIFTDVRWHVMGKGWWGSSYYMSIDYDGTRLICRKRTEKGWHCGGGKMNHTALAICLRGNLDNHPPTPEQLESLHEALIEENEHYGRRLAIKWHGDYVATSCPGKYMPKYEIEAAVEAHYTPTPPAEPETDEPVVVKPEPPAPPEDKEPDDQGYETPIGGCAPMLGLIASSVVTAACGMALIIYLLNL